MSGITSVTQAYPFIRTNKKDSASNCLFSSFNVASPPPRAHSAATCRRTVSPRCRRILEKNALSFLCNKGQCLGCQPYRHTTHTRPTKGNFHRVEAFSGGDHPQHDFIRVNASTASSKDLPQYLAIAPSCLPIERVVDADAGSRRLQAIYRYRVLLWLTKNRWSHNPSRPDFVATHHPGLLGQAQAALAQCISSRTLWQSPAGTWRSRGRCAAPVVKPSFHLFTPNSNARNRVGVPAVS